MFKSMRLSLKIAAGFVAVLCLALAVGALALWNMKKIESLAGTLSGEYVPEVAIANNIERNSLSAMFEMRGYALSEDRKYLDAAKKNLQEVHTFLKAGTQLVSKSLDLEKMKAGLVVARAKVSEYEQLINQTVERNEAVKNLRKMMDEAAGSFLSAAKSYRRNMNQAMKEEMKDSTEAERLLQRHSKISMINDVIDLGNSIRIANFKFQALEDSKFLDNAQQDFAAIGQILSDLKSITAQEQNLKDLAEASAAAAAYLQHMRGLSAEWKVLADLKQKREQAGAQVLLVAKESAETGMAHTNEVAAVASSSLSSASLVLSAGLGIVLLLGLCLAFFISASITRPIDRVVRGLSEGAGQVAAASQQLSSSSQQLAEGASEQAASLEETSSSLEEMASMTMQNAENSTQATALMKETCRAFSAASESMKELTVSMAEISTASEETRKIVKTIDEIAFQTNLLALNAAVEAARAGESGAGFAVVADEVRNLAQRAADAARNTASMIDGTVKRVGGGTEVVQRTQTEFARAAESATSMTQLIASIAEASREQAQGIEQLNRAVAEVDKVVQHNAANAEESASASEEMNAQAYQMRSFVAELDQLVGGKAKDKRKEIETAEALLTHEPDLPVFEPPASFEVSGTDLLPPPGRRFSSRNA